MRTMKKKVFLVKPSVARKKGVLNLSAKWGSSFPYKFLLGPPSSYINHKSLLPNKCWVHIRGGHLLVKMGVIQWKHLLLK